MQHFWHKFHEKLAKGMGNVLIGSKGVRSGAPQTPVMSTFKRTGNVPGISPEPQVVTGGRFKPLSAPTAKPVAPKLNVDAKFPSPKVKMPKIKGGSKQSGKGVADMKI